MPNQVYVGCTNVHRRIVGVLQGYVVYSKGGDGTRSCKTNSFKRWIRRSAAVLMTEAER